MVRKLTYVLFVFLYSIALALPAMATGSSAATPLTGDAAADPETDQTGIVSDEEIGDDSSPLEDSTGVPVEDLIDDGDVLESVSVDQSDDILPAVLAIPRSVDIDIGNVSPDIAPFYGSGYVSGWDDSLGDITLYIPVSYMDGYLGVDGSGNLMNISSTSITGYLEGVYNNSVTIPAFSYPRYRSGSGYDYEYIYMVPENSNMEIATDFPASMSMDEFIGYASILLLGVIVLCCMKRS